MGIVTGERKHSKIFDDQLNNLFIVSLGASSAVGMAICENLVENGMTVCALARAKGKKRLDVRPHAIFKRAKSTKTFTMKPNILLFVGDENANVRHERKVSNIRSRY